MHELSVAQNIIDIITENLSPDDVRKVRCVRVRIGELAAVLPDSLDFCFKAIIRGTPLEDARLDIERTDIILQCGICGGKSAVKDSNLKCPVCGSVTTEVISGDELQVVEIEVEDGR